MVKDRYGYLWITTTNGVARYNGYDIQVYTTADGLPSNDVWSIHLDKKERLWLLCFTNRPGYIYKNRYHETHVANYDYSLSAERLGEYKNGIVFMSKAKVNVGYSLFKEKNDTITHIRSAELPWFLYVSNTGELFYGNQEKNNIYTYNLDNESFRIKHRCTYDSIVVRLRHKKYRFLYYDKEILYTTDKNLVYSLSMSTCKLDTFAFPNGPITKILHTDRYLYVLTGNKVYQFDSSLTLQHTASVSEITNGCISSANDLVYLAEDRLWGKKIATQAHGMFIIQGKTTPFKKIHSFNNQGYKYIGNIDDSAGYWWNTGTGTVTRAYASGRVHHYKLTTRDNIRKILPLSEGKSLLFTPLFPKTFFSKTGVATDIIPYHRSKKYVPSNVAITEAIVHNDTVYGISSSGFFKCHVANDTFNIEALDADKWTGILDDSVRKQIWVYNTGNIMLCNRDGKKLQVPVSILKSTGVKHIEQIVLDNRYGNIFVKDGDKLLCINLQNASTRQLFSNCNLTDAKIYKQGNTLIAAGKFGVAFCKIRGRNSFSEPIIYFNEKLANYLVAYDAHISQNNVLLNTDNGLYSIDLPGDAMYTGIKHHEPFRLVMTYDGDMFRAKNNDSFFINQDNNKLVLDIIKPSGKGQAKYQYMVEGIDSSWHEMISSELSLSNLDPGRYYTLLLKIKDDVWRSSTIRFHVYTIPFWWQTNPGRTMVWLAGIALLAGLIVSTVAVTRKITMRNNLKKNKLLELEIKSIHSQINPHFIFNTLNTTLHYIVKRKLDEAYDHVSSFSSLLRAYLKSSRNRYITLGEEINNLRNYIHLQQTRFENIFTYEIVTDMPQCTTVNVPSLLLQPIVENAINHGLLPKNAPGHLKLTFSANPDTGMLTCVIDDDGVGRKKHDTPIPNDPNQRESYGNQLIKELVDILNKYENAGIEIKYIDKELPQTGTTVIITIKNALKDG